MDVMSGAPNIVHHATHTNTNNSNSGDADAEEDEEDLISDYDKNIRIRAIDVMRTPEFSRVWQVSGIGEVSS